MKRESCSQVHEQSRIRASSATLASVQGDSI
jgi:hypothetical protein